MNPLDPDVADSDPTISSNPGRPPWLPPKPPITPSQAIQALLSPESQDYALLHGLRLPHESGLAQALVNGAPLSTKSPGLAQDLQDHGITSLPYADPRLVNITMNRAMPTFQTAKGTTIQMNSPAPKTMLPYGAGLDRLITFSDTLGAPTVKINGGSEATGHSANPLDAHPANKAIDVAADPSVADEQLKDAALAAGYTHGIREINNGAVHLHFQVGPDNIQGDPDLYDLTHSGPIQTKGYTKPAGNSPPEGSQ